MIAIENVSKLYQRGPSQVAALKDVSLSFGDGRFIALMGPSGSGKSTLLNLVSGLDIPTTGRISVDGYSLESMHDSALTKFRSTHIGIVFQSFNLVPVLSALENVALPLLLRPLSRADRLKRARTALEIVGLAQRLDHRPNTLSGGEQQRVAIARAIVTDPKVIVADEPTGDLDAENAAAILGLLRELRKTLGKTVLMVTHDARAEGYVDETHVLDKGILSSAALVRGAA